MALGVAMNRLRETCGVGGMMESQRSDTANVLRERVSIWSAIGDEADVGCWMSRCDTAAALSWAAILVLS